MDEFSCDYRCRTVGEAIEKYKIDDDWCAEFDACDGDYPIVCVQANMVCRTPAMMELSLRIVENEDDEYAGCMIFPDQKIIAFKVDFMADLIRAMRMI